MTIPTGRARATIGGAIASEWIKLRGVRSTWWIVSLSIAVPLLAIAIWALNATPASTSAFDESNAVLGSVTSSIFETLVLFVLFGALVATSEYDTRTITTTLAAVPRRWPVVLAKATVVATSTLVLSLVVLTLGFVIAAALVPTTTPVMLAEPGVMAALLGTALVEVSAALISLFLGLILRSSIGAIAATFGFFYVVPGVINLISLPPFQLLGHSFPGPASDSLTALTAPTGALPYPVAAVTVILWTAIWLGIGIVLTRRRDI